MTNKTTTDEWASNLSCEALLESGEKCNVRCVIRNDPWDYLPKGEVDPEFVRCACEKHKLLIGTKVK